MKKLNNKGFAISTVIYGISIMAFMLITIIMANMSAIRKNNTELSKAIEEDLCRLSRTDARFNSRMSGTSPLAQEYTVPTGEDGWYRIELWGSSGGNSDSGRGAYTSGIIYLTGSQTLYFYVGEQQAGKGGTTTEVRTSATGYNTAGNNRIMVAAGGGLDAGADGGTLYGQTANMASHDGIIKIEDRSYELIENEKLVGYPETYPTSGSGLISGCSGDGTAPNQSDAGGDGYVGSSSSSSGGVSFIRGYAGCKGNTGDGFYFVDGMMMPGVRIGSGEAHIEKILSKKDYDTLPRKNTKLNNVVEVEDCFKGSSDLQTNCDMIAMSNGSKISASKEAKTISGNKCCVYSFSSAANVDELSFWHTKDKIGGVDFVKHTIKVKYQGSATKTTIKTFNDGVSTFNDLPSETETPTGIRISAYQHDPTVALPDHGTYYILPVLSENKVMSAGTTELTEQEPIKYDYLNGLASQKWSIDKITNTNITPVGTVEYKITELARHKALSITADENIIQNTVSANNPFNESARNEPQIWTIISLNNGTYAIVSAAESLHLEEDVIDDETLKYTGSLVAQTADDPEELTKGQIVIARNDDSGNIIYKTQRFKLIDIDYSSS